MTSQQAPPMARPRISAGALFTDADGGVLLVRPTYKPYWDIPGGYVEPGESPLAACRREIREELGITPAIRPQTFAIDGAPAEGEGDKILFVFDGGYLDDEDLAAITFADGEIAEIRYVPPAELDAYVPARLARRIHSALTAKQNGHPVYAEHGTPV
jgi:8-oxo-dGTP pyrophosphatase MutT (NUDIX family)